MSPKDDLTRDERRRLAREKRKQAEAAALKSGRRRKHAYLFSGMFLVVAAVVIIVIVISSSGGSKKSIDPVGVAKTNTLIDGIPQSGATLGNPNAPVTMTMFIDLKCPYCREFDMSVLPALIPKYVRTGKVKLVAEIQHFVGDDPNDTERAAQFAAAVGFQNKEWNFIELFYDNQRNEATTYVTDDFLKALASDIPGLDVKQAFKQRSSSKVASILTQATTLFDQDGFEGTPSFLLGKAGQTPKAIPPQQSFTTAEFFGPIDKLLGES